jgi:hypothetical protein
VDGNAQHRADGRSRDHWDRLDDFLRTDPRDAGCDETVELLDVYAELVAAGSDPAARFPGVHAHVTACELCAQALAGLLTAITIGPPAPDLP